MTRERLPGTLFFVGLLVCLLASRSAAKRDKLEMKVVEEEDGQYVHLVVEGDPAAQAWLYRPLLGGDDEEAQEEEGAAPQPARKHDLIVALHGAGGNPKNFVMPTLMEERGAWCLTVAGRRTVQTESGTGFLWDGGNVAYIVGFVQYLLSKYPLDRDRVIVWGHSAGGTMTLATLAKAPKLFAGGLTTAAPRTPSGQHKELRTCVFLGTEDLNWAGAATVRSFVESLATKNRKKGGACAFLAVDGLGHDIPYDEYLGLGFDWILHGRARGGEARVGRRPKGAEGPWRHILVRHKGAQGAEGVKRSKTAAKKLLKGIAKELDKERAFFPYEAACHSEDPDTASCGGGIEADALEALLGQLPALEPGAVSEILTSELGMHLVTLEAED